MSRSTPPALPPRRKHLDLDDYARGVLACDRAILGRAITLIESRHPDRQQLAQDLLVRLTPHTGAAIRIGISGVPGAGKSTLIEHFGSNLTAQGHKVAVLAVDPSSAISGGSILGDKTRMAKLSADPNAFIRPSPSSGTLGGVARRTRETMLLCEAAGFDVIIVETVGVGQSEATVARMVDVFVLLMLSGGGDELQGIKRGILELADIFAINKADGDNQLKANKARRELESALHLMRPHDPRWQAPVLAVSGLENQGLDELWETVNAYRSALQADGGWQQKRQSQLLDWMWTQLEDRLMMELKNHPGIRKLAPSLEDALLHGTSTPTRAANELLTRFLQNKK